MKLVTGIAALTVAIAAAYAAPANAQATTAHTISANAPGFCQGALPAFAGTLRARPLALQNEGTAAAFVTCAFPYDSGIALNNGALKLEVYFNNRATTAQAVTCTAVSGYAASGTAVYVNGSATVPAAVNGVAGDIGLFWDAADFSDGLQSGFVSISCQLPANVGIADSYLDFAS